MKNGDLNIEKKLINWDYNKLIIGIINSQWGSFHEIGIYNKLE